MVSVPSCGTVSLLREAHFNPQVAGLRDFCSQTVSSTLWQRQAKGSDATNRGSQQPSSMTWSVVPGLTETFCTTKSTSTLNPGMVQRLRVRTTNSIATQHARYSSKNVIVQVHTCNAIKRSWQNLTAQMRFPARVVRICRIAPRKLCYAPITV